MLFKDLKNDFRIALMKSFFAQEASQQHGYSLRRFAERLEIEASTLSQYFRGKRPITDKSFDYVRRNYGMSAKEVREAFENYLKNHENKYLLPHSQRELTRHWYYFAILELTATNEFQPDVNWIAERLGLSPVVCGRAIDMLFEVGAITREDNGRWRDTLENITFVKSEDMDTDDGRSFQKQLLVLADASIEKVDGTKKSHTNIMSAIDEDLVPELKLKIKNFRREIARFIEENSKKKDALYNLQINFHPLTRK